MPPPIKVELLPHDLRWTENATAEAEALAEAIGPCLLTVHHVGSTAIPGIRAKPILDLMPVVVSLSKLEKRQHHIEALGYKWWGELGLPGRRYCTKDNPATGLRLIQLHCYVDGSAEITRHLAFRDTSAIVRRSPPRMTGKRSVVRACTLTIPMPMAIAKKRGSRRSRQRRSRNTNPDKLSREFLFL